MKKGHRIAVFAAVVLLLGLTIDKVFSLGLLGATLNPKAPEINRNLLISEMDGLLPEKEAHKIIRSLDTLVAGWHTVGRNEWLEKIAVEYGVPALAIRSTNNLEDPLLRPSQQILVQNKNGMVHLARGDEPLDSIVARYAKLGSREALILAGNPIEEISEWREGKLYVREGSRLWIPNARLSFPYLARPVFWNRISRGFGIRRHPILKVRRRHSGYDMAAPYGAPVYASQAGEIVFAGWNGGYGNMIDIRHSKITTRYGHLSALYVKAGDRVKKKQLIGRVGTSGLATGPHLHFEVILNKSGQSVRPGRYLY